MGKNNTKRWETKQLTKEWKGLKQFIMFRQKQSWEKKWLRDKFQVTKFWGEIWLSLNLRRFFIGNGSCYAIKKKNIEVQDQDIAIGSMLLKNNGKQWNQGIKLPNFNTCWDAWKENLLKNSTNLTLNSSIMKEHLNNSKIIIRK